MASHAVILRVRGMTCPACEETLERTIARVPGVSDARAEHRAGTVRVATSAPVPLHALHHAIEDAGYDVEAGGTG